MTLPPQILDIIVKTALEKKQSINNLQLESFYNLVFAPAFKLYFPKPKPSDEEVSSYFEVYMTALYQHQISGYATGSWREEDRQANIKAFHAAITSLLKRSGGIDASDDVVVWSKPEGMLAASTHLIKGKRGKIINESAIGKFIETITMGSQKHLNTTWDQDSVVWSALSYEYAKKAEGSVHVFVPEHIGAGTVFWNVELAALRERQHEKKVTDIHVHTLKPDIWALIQSHKEAITKLNESDDKSPAVISEIHQLRQQNQALVVNPENWQNHELEIAPIKMSQEGSTFVNIVTLKLLATRWKKYARARKLAREKIDAHGIIKHWRQFTHTKTLKSAALGIAKPVPTSAQSASPAVKASKETLKPSK